ncbi:L,D-transpeptidase [Catellatospora citrea]|uniref:Putative conserved lipoprotein LppS n=1 Tax=Catellatospora citrea TaxID=53366 RepID=A0A8J3P1I4_9ACTN|nr:Ig-like domain-containing protein [Catellatospora citrea]RKE06220.1 lipoprotein-anchoring transpeptidase ErfK/SrfK [Catellatospora citrea]GIG00559.1 putative conserved lipoprotein LppS [Catellatospora citrea]
MPSFPRPDLGPLTRRSALAALGLTGAAIGLAACTGSKSPSGTASPGQSPEGPPPKAHVTITEPAAAATEVPASAEIVFAATDAVSTQVVLKDAAGVEVAGELHPDGKGWLPAKSLAYGTAYTVTVTATGDDGKPATATSTFTTMAQPDKVVSIVSFLPDDAVVGVGMPLIFRLSRKIPEAQRAALQRRLLVQTTPAQEGIWTWYTPDELHWRPREFWQAGTKVFVDVRAGGLPLGDGYFGKRNSTLTCAIGRSLVMTIDDKAKPKVMKVVKDGATVRTIRVSLGRASMPSSSGTTVIIERLAKTVFDTTNDPNPANRYRTNIEYAQRLTWGGEFIHAAPWSVKDQGVRNVSHGCVNMSLADAKWLFEQTMIGDPVVTKGTPRRLQYGNGWTDWDKPWDEYVKGSAIPYTPSADPSPEPTASPVA